MKEKTLGQIAFAAFYEALVSDGEVEAEWQAIADAVVAEHERRKWNQWPDGDDHEYPPDEVDVLIYCGNWHSKDMVIGRVSKRCGVYGPSGATHWHPLPPAPEVE